MPDPRLHGDRGERRAAAHDLICTAKEPDGRYYQKVSNANKVEFICGAIEYPAEAFDLENAFPIEDWFASGDLGLLCAGLYLNDLRDQFYDLQVKNDPALRREVFEVQALAEFWRLRFHQVLTRKETGRLVVDKRVRH